MEVYGDLSLDHFCPTEPWRIKTRTSHSETVWGWKQKWWSYPHLQACLQGHHEHSNVLPSLWKWLDVVWEPTSC